MPAISLEAFWSSVAASRLIPAEEMPAVIEAFARSPRAASDPAQLPAAAGHWLVSEGRLTLWQARRLARGDQGPFFLGAYRLLDLHERWGGVTLSARHEPSGRTVALVPLAKHRCQLVEVWTEIVERTAVAHEATAESLSRTWALEQAEGGRFLVCEEVTGPTLAAWVAKHGPFPPVEALQILLSICRGLACLHRLGTPHGDLTPEEVVLQKLPPDAKGHVRIQPRLLQYPLAGDPHAEPGHLPAPDTAATERYGTRSCFVAPERAAAKGPATPTADVHAIGCLLATMLTGEPPGWLGSAAATLTARGAMTTPLQADADVPDAIRKLLEYLTAARPEERYADAAAAADAVAQCLGLPPVSPELHAQRPQRQSLLQTPAAAAEERTPPAPSDPFAIRTDLPARPRRSSSRSLPLLIGGALAALGLATAAVVLLRSGPTAPPNPELEANRPLDFAERREQSADQAPAPNEAEEQQARYTVADDPDLPWLPPTAGQPPRFAYLPPGCQLILLARPAELLATAEGKRLLEAVEAGLAEGLQLVEQVSGSPLADIDMLQVGWQSDVNGQPQAGLVIRTRRPLAIARAEPGGTTLGPTGWSLWRPPDNDSLLVAAAEPLLKIILATADEPLADGMTTAVPRSMRPLVPLLDADRHLTVIGDPHYLRYAGRGLLGESLARMTGPLEDFLGADVPAAAASLHCSESSYFELDIVPSTTRPARQLQEALRECVDGLATAAETTAAALPLAPYGKRAVLRLPGMLRLLAKNCRSGTEGSVVVANAYLPTAAPHNLAVATELLLAQWTAGGGVNDQSISRASQPAAAMQKSETPSAADPPADSRNQEVTP
jgi:serine/threonine protein kinase